MLAIVLTTPSSIILLDGHSIPVKKLKGYGVIVFQNVSCVLKISFHNVEPYDLPMNDIYIYIYIYTYIYLIPEL